jgi:hypothetical protein
MLRVAIVGGGGRRCSLNWAKAAARGSSIASSSTNSPVRSCARAWQSMSNQSTRDFLTSVSTLSVLPDPVLQQPPSSSISEVQTNASDLLSLPEGAQVSIGGWIISIRRVSKNLAFAVLLLPRGQGRLQLVARNESIDNLQIWEQAGLHGVVFIKGRLYSRPEEGQARKSDDVSMVAFRHCG